MISECHQIVAKARALSKELQAQAKCPKFEDLTKEQQRLLAVKTATMCGVSVIHRNLWFDGRHKKVEKALTALVESGRSLLLAGPVGVGKTAYLSAMLKERFLIESRRSPNLAYTAPTNFAIRSIFLTHQEVVDVIHAGYRENSTVAHTLTELMECQNLMIDDLATGHDDGAGFNLGQLEMVINERWSNGRTTWIALNISAADLKKMQGWERIYDRMSDKGWMQYVVIPGKSRRGEA